MPYKDTHGIWRNDQPTGDHGELLDACPNCGMILDVGCIPECSDYDGELAADWGVDRFSDPRSEFLNFIAECAICDTCNIEIEYGPDYYYNPDTNNYDLLRPLTIAEAERAEAEALRKQQEAAGQLALFE